MTYKIYLLQDAKNLPDLVFTVNGKDLVIPATEHVTDLELGDGNCALGGKNLNHSDNTEFNAAFLNCKQIFTKID
jgi:hypothetical protein